MTSQRRVLVTPRDLNPYQTQLYGTLAAEGWVVHYCEGLTRSQTLNVVAKPLMLVWHRVQGFRLLHVHWIYDFAVPWAQSSLIAARALQLWFRLYLATARLLGIKVVWTAHNVLPHAKVFHNDRVARQHLVAEAEAVIALSESSIPALTALGARNVRVIPFGSYRQIPASPDDVASDRTASARQVLRLDATDFVAVFVGRIEPYKGVEQLVRSIVRIDTTRKVRLLVGGECKSAQLRSSIEASAGTDARVRLQLEWLTDADVALYLDAADVAIFPFECVTNSSSIALALCHGVPVIAPRFAALHHIPESCGNWYQPDDPNGLDGALSQTLNLTHEQRAAQRTEALRYTESFDWQAVGQATERLYDEVLSR